MADDADTGDESAAARPILFDLETYREQMIAIRDLVAVIKQNQVVLDNREEKALRLARRIIPWATQEHISQALSIHDSFFSRMTDIINEIPPNETEKFIKDQKPVPQELIDKVGAVLQEARVRLSFLATKYAKQEDSGSLGELPADDGLFAVLTKTALERSPNSRILYSSLLATAVSNFEVLFGGLIRWFLQARPESLSSAEPKISWSELNSYGSLDAFRASYIDKLASEVMRGGLDDWMKWLSIRAKVELEDVSFDPAATIEIFQRRHIFIHNGGRVSRQYLDKLKGESDLPPEGQTLTVSAGYLNNAVDNLLAFGTAIVWVAVNHLKAAPLEVSERLLLDRTFDDLKDHRNDSVIKFVNLIGSRIKDDSCRLPIMVNRWIAMKRNGGTGSIRSEVEAWNTSTLSKRFRIAKDALLDRDEEVRSAVPQLIESGEITDSEWRTWPLFEALRSADTVSDVSQVGDQSSE